VLRLAASLAGGIPVDLRDALTGMDTANVDRAVRAMLHASGRRARTALNVREPGCYRHDFLAMDRSTVTLICDGAARSCSHTLASLSRSVTGLAVRPGDRSKLPI
jgi:hypothetical protein